MFGSRLIIALILVVFNEKFSLGESGELGFQLKNYKNKIKEVIPPFPYTEICFKRGRIHLDIHQENNSPSNKGHCLPGDSGFIIERNERFISEWYFAKENCLQSGMRLPKAFEWQLACNHAKDWSLKMNRTDWEWTSGPPKPSLYKGHSGVGVTVLGKNACNHSDLHWLALDSGYSSSYSFRCAL